MISHNSSSSNLSTRRTGMKDYNKHRQAIKETIFAPYKELLTEQNMNYDMGNDDFAELNEQKFDLENSKGINKKDYIVSLFPRKLFADLYFAWCKDCSENISAENAKYFRDELLMRKNKDKRNYNFHSMRIAKNFIIAYVGNIDSSHIVKLDLSDNLITDICMHNLKNVISSKRCEVLNLASNMISTEGLKIIQNEIIQSDHLKYLNLGICDGSFRRNNFSGEGGLVLARIILSNTSLETLILQDNDLGEEAAEKIGSALIQNSTLKKLFITDNKIKNKGARSIIENAGRLKSLNLSNNEITSEVCIDLEELLRQSNNLIELIWDLNQVGKGIRNIIDGIRINNSLKLLSLKNVGIGVNGLKFLSDGLKYNSNLSVLDLSINQIKYENFKEICDSMNTNKIKNIKLKNNNLGDESMKYFADNILHQETKSNINSFDFSACKIYDQGMIYILNGLQNNNVIQKVKLKDNYFSHEIDYVIIGLIEKNFTLLKFDVLKNRLSNQCISSIRKIIERNNKIENEKEMNKLLVEVYKQKYDNTKLNEMKEALKLFETDVEAYKQGRAEIRTEYVNWKKLNDEDITDMNKRIDKIKYNINNKKIEYNEKLSSLEEMKKSNEEKLSYLNDRFNELKVKKKELEEESDKIKNLTDNMEKELHDKIEEAFKKINENKLNEIEYYKLKKITTEEVISLDKQIQALKNSSN